MFLKASLLLKFLPKPSRISLSDITFLRLLWRRMDGYFTISLCVTLCLSQPSRKRHCESNFITYGEKGLRLRLEPVWFTAQPCEPALESLLTTTHKSLPLPNIILPDCCELFHHVASRTYNNKNVKLNNIFLFNKIFCSTKVACSITKKTPKIIFKLENSGNHDSVFQSYNFEEIIRKRECGNWSNIFWARIYHSTGHIALECLCWGFIRMLLPFDRQLSWLCRPLFPALSIHHPE